MQVHVVELYTSIKWLWFCLLPAAILFSPVSNAQERYVPFPAALADASIKLDSLSSEIDASLIIGNGDINALLYSDSASIIMNLTKNDVWDARLETVNDPPIPTLELIRQLGASDTAFPLSDNNSGYVLPEGMAWEAKDSYHKNAYPCPRQCARIIITGSASPKAAGRSGGLFDLQRAVAKVYDTGTNTILAEVRALADRNVFLIKTEGELHLVPITSKGLPPAEQDTTDGIMWLKQRIPGDPDWPGMSFAVAAFSLNNWHAVSIVTSLECEDVVHKAVTGIGQVMQMEPADLIGNHEIQWQYFWSKSGISLSNRLLQRCWYRSLYFLRCVSKPGVQSVGLFAGLINDTPAWHGDYHTNYNIQQTYWAAFAANHPELCEPYDRLMFEYLPRAKWLANKVFSMSGAYYPHVLYAFEPPDPDTCKSRNGRQYVHHTWGMTLGVSGFSVQPLWWRYKYDPDPERLHKIVYPVIRDVAVFYAEFIERCEGNATIRLGPSVSPEHWGWTKYLQRNYDGTFDIAMIQYILNAAIEAAQILDRDQKLIDRFRAALQRLPDYPRTAETSPVIVDVAGAPIIEYNIPVPSTPVFPGDMVTYWSSDDAKEIFIRTIEQLRWNGNNATVMLAVARARLRISNTENWLQNEIAARTRSNGTLSLNTLKPYHRFNDFGHYTEQFGAGMAISECLLQSVGDIIRVFPALDQDTQACFTDLRAQGGFLVTAAGSAETVTDLQIKSLHGGILRLSNPWQRIGYRKSDETDYQVLEQDVNGIVSMKTRTGDVLHFKEHE
jgi:hypothetical protein